MKEGAEGGLPLFEMAGGVGVVADVFEGDELLGGGGSVEDAAGIVEGGAGIVGAMEE